MKLSETYPVIIHAEDGQFWAEAPDVPSALTRGDSMEETAMNMKEALELALATTTTVPTPTRFEAVQSDDGTVQLVTVPLADALRKHSKAF